MPQPPSVNAPEPDQQPNVEAEGRGVPRGDAPNADGVGTDAEANAYARDFADWVEARRHQMAERWSALVLQRTGRSDAPVDPLLGRFYALCLRLLPACLGPYRSQFIPLYRSLAELYGSVGAARGLAAGEIIEEVQLLREVLIRRLVAEPPQMRRAPVLLREILRLNRMVDRAVTYASVGHTDAMFFSLFQGSGIPAQLTGELRAEVTEQLDEILRETEELLEILSRQ